jgi:hypothetical protein
MQDDVTEMLQPPNVRDQPFANLPLVLFVNHNFRRTSRGICFTSMCVYNGSPSESVRIRGGTGRGMMRSLTAYYRL